MSLFVYAMKEHSVLIIAPNDGLLFVQTGIVDILAQANRLAGDRAESEAIARHVARIAPRSGRMVKVLSWYDNEWGFSNRLVDLATLIGRKGA
jgi:glyceraldehyde-3-phosphate dehydrogenase/erythrose-4-phosphate dehydrogenase